MRARWIIGNWKMNLGPKRTADAVRELLTLLPPDLGEDDDEDRHRVHWAVCPMAPCLSSALDVLHRTRGGERLHIGAQNVHARAKGAYTGEWDAATLKELGISLVIVGHSERREHAHETNAEVRAKAAAAWEAGLLPVICVGEHWEDRQKSRTFEVIDAQLEVLIRGSDPHFLRAMALAYEPVWAIGTGLTATPAQASEVHAHIRKRIADWHRREVAEQMPILYGGSAKPDNAAALLAAPHVDGLLVGGASLDPKGFAAILRASVEVAKG